MKTYLFKLMNASYEARVIMLTANSLKEAVRLADFDNPNKHNFNLVKGFNYDPADIKNLNASTYCIYLSHRFPELERNKDGYEIPKHWLNKGYPYLLDTMIAHDQYRGTKQGIDSIWLSTNHEWWDVLEFESNLPEGFVFEDGHSG